jgi:hypothetical protein
MSILLGHPLKLINKISAIYKNRIIVLCYCRVRNKSIINKINRIGRIRCANTK